MTVTNFAGPDADLPTGSIISWHDSISNIPFGWALCDGNNGTPNLIETFPRSVPDGTTDPGGVGGNNSITLTESQLPSHSHNPGSTDTSGSHNHKFGDSAEYGQNYNTYTSGSDENNSTGTNGAHTHGSGYTASEGGGGSIDNQPAYEETLFIKRID
jgi:microcystin-dependent protein